MVLYERNVVSPFIPLHSPKKRTLNQLNSMKQQSFNRLDSLKKHNLNPLYSLKEQTLESYILQYNKI